MRRRLSPAVLLIAVLSGCAASPAEDQAASLVPVDAPTPPQTTDDIVAGDDTAPAGATVEPAPTGVLRVAVVGVPEVDPAEASIIVPGDMVALDLLYDGLTRWDVDAGTWEPALAESIEVSGGGRRHTIRLGPHRFSDGTPILADDVVASIEHLRGAADPVVRARLDAIEAVTAIDDRTVRIVLGRPDRQLPALLTSPMFGVAPHGVFDGVVGSGPMMSSTTSTSTLELWRRTDAREAVTGVHLIAMSDIDAALAAVDRGEADLAYVPASHAGPVDLRAPSTIDVFFAVNEAVRAALDAQAAPFSMVDPAVLADAGIGAGRVALPWETPPVCTDCALPQPATGAAPLEIAYIVGPDGSESRDRAMSEALVAALAGAGVPAEAVGMTIGELVAAVAAGDHDIVRAGAVGLFPDDAARLGLLSTESGENLTGAGDSRIAVAIDRALRLATPAALRALDDAVMESGLVLPVGRVEVRAVLADRVSGLELSHDGTFDVAAVSLG